MAMTGFFTRVEVKAKAITRKEQGLSVERLHQLGIKGVERMNPHAKTKHMEPSGSNRPEVYILGEAPSEADDNEGEPFVGASGKYLRQYLPDDVKIRINNCVRTLPIRRAKGSRKPTTHEIECYRKTAEADIVQTKPRIILALGDTATQWCLGHEVGQISCCRGRRFPTEIAGHKLWVYSAHHPAYILRQLDNEEYEQIPGEEHARYFQKDVVRVFDDLDSLPDPPVEDLTKLYDETKIELTDAQKIVNFLHKAAEDEGVCGIDVETNRERPYSTGARILSLSVSSSFGALAFPVDHPGAKWSKSDYQKIDQAIRHFLKSPVKKVAHNTPFDLEWLIWKYGKEVAFTCFWHDSMSQAFVLDERKGGMGLNFLNILHFGLKLKKQSVGRAESVWFGMGVETSGEIDRVKLEQTNVEDVCKYNGLDSKYCRKLYYVQKGLLQDRGLWEPYREFVKRVPSITTAQEHGIPVDQKVVIEFQKKEGDFLKSIRQQITNLEVVRKYNKRYGEYDPNSHPHNIKMFSELLGYEEVRLKGGRFSTKEEILSKLDEPLAKLIVELRGHQKLKGTYIDRMRPDHEKPLVFPDGKIHCHFNHTRTDTGRLCVAEDTILETSLGSFKISECPLQKNGQNCLIRTHENRWRKIQAKWFKGYEPMLRLVFSNGASIECTKGHRILCKAGWKQAGDLRLGESAVADPSFAGGYDSRESVRRVWRGFTEEAKDSSGMVCDRILPEKDDTKRTAGKRNGSSVQSGFSLEAVVSSQTLQGIQGSVPEKLLGEQNGEHSWPPPPQNIASIDTTSIVGTSRVDGRKNCEILSKFGVFSSSESNLSSDKAARRPASAVWANQSKRMVSVGSLVSWTGGSTSRGKESEEPATGRIQVLEDFSSLNKDSRKAKTLRKNHDRGSSKKEGQASLLVIEQGGIENYVGVDAEKNPISASDSDYQTKLRGFRTSNLQCNFGSGWGLSFYERSRTQGQCEGLPVYEIGLSNNQDNGHSSPSSYQTYSFANYKTVELISIQNLLPQAVWDITVEEDHSYASQGLFHHNSSSDPNAQNYPSREDKWIRAQIAAPSGMVMLCCDQGQLEFRGIGMASKDKVIIDSLFGGYDVHRAWAIKIAKVYPKVVRDRHGSLNEKAMKAFRGELKTDVIFPWFYGASLYLAARALDHMPPNILEPIKEEFDDTFAGVIAYQEEQQEFYHKHGYVETLTGRRRHGPMSRNQLINAPIQGGCSDILCWSWNELNRIAHETERPWLAPCLNVHDDLSFFIPKKHLDESVEVIVRAMCLVPFDFINVPLMVEVKVGPNWYKQEEIGQFRSDQLDERMIHYFSEVA